MEGVCIERFEVHDFRSSRAVYGELDGGKDGSPTMHCANAADVNVAHLGPVIFIDGCADHNGFTVPPSCASLGFNGSILRKPHLLFHLLV
jgi:hypothetical protein